MGQAIVYCWKCGSILKNADFDRKKAFRVGIHLSCEHCLDELLASLPEEERERIRKGVTGKPAPAPRDIGTKRKSQTDRIPLAGGTATRRRSVGARDRSNLATVLILAAGAVVVVALAATMSGAGGTGTTPEPGVSRPPEPPPPPPQPPQATPAPRRTDPKPGPEPRKLVKVGREAEVRKAVSELKAYIGANPGEFDEILRRSKRLARSVEGTSHQTTVEGFIKSAREGKKSQILEELVRLKTQAKGLIDRGDFGATATLIDKHRPRHPLPEWSREFDDLRASLEAKAEATLKTIIEEAVAAKRKANQAGVDSRKRVVAAWKLPALAARLDKAVAKAKVGEPATPEARGARSAWEKAMADARALDFEAAERKLKESAEKAKEPALKKEIEADVRFVREAAKAHAAGLGRLSRWPKGRNLKIQYRGPAGSLVTTEGSVFSLDQQLLQILEKGRRVDVMLPEVTPQTWIELHDGGRKRETPEERRTAAAVCLLSGDAVAARAHLDGKEDGIPRKYWLHVEKGASNPEEKAARALFSEAEREFVTLKARGRSGAKYASLLAKHASSPFVRRNRDFIERRKAESAEHLFTVEHLQGAGSFMQLEYKGVGPAWTSAADYDARSLTKNYAEFSFTAQAGREYRAWIYAGACCAETYAFSVQATGLEGPAFEGSKAIVALEPGAAEAMPVKLRIPYVKKHHLQHGGGPKTPARWNWVALPLPESRAAGVRTVRIVTGQKGFSVAYVLVSANRRRDLRGTEKKAIVKREAALAAARNAGWPAVVATGKILREYWLNSPGSKIPDLKKTPGYPDKPAGSDFLTTLEAPKQFAENFSARIRGYVHPPITGEYVFWICSDDNSEFWLSTDESPLKKQLMCSLDGAAKPGEWEYQPTTKSRPVRLSAGKRYYVEVLHKEGALEDHVAVGWKLPNGTLERPIPGGRLSPPGSGRSSASVDGSRREFYRGVNFNGPKIEIAGKTWEGKDAPNVAVSGIPRNKPEVALDPPTDPERSTMIRSFVYDRPNGTRVRMTSVPPGTYEAYLYLWEDNDPEQFDVLVNGKKVRSKYRSGPQGRWERLGPWTVDVRGGAIDMAATGVANFSGIEIWRVYR